MKGDKGFTLTELMVSLVISGVLMTAVYSVFNSQQKSYAVQDQMTAAHQNLRGAMNLMVKEIRMAGYDPYRNYGARVETAKPKQIKFTLVSDGDGYDNDNDEVVDEIGELKTIQYSLYDSGDDDDTDLGRRVGQANNQPVAQNIDVLSFVYLDEEGKALSFPIINLSAIRAVQITLVARTAKPDPAFKQNGGFRIKTLTEHVVCRNLAF